MAPRAVAPAPTAPAEGRAAPVDSTRRESSSPPTLEWQLGQYRVSSEPLRNAPNESSFGCSLDALGGTTPLAVLELDRRLRVWASVGPSFSEALTTGRAVLSISPESSPSQALACGVEVSVDLPPGRYLIRGQQRLTAFGQAYRPAGDGFAYRVSEVGDDSCPTELAVRGIHDWDGEFPFTVDFDWDLDRDGHEDARVEYQMAFMNPGTRILLAEQYPRCLRIAADEPALVRRLPSHSAGATDLYLSYWELHPVETFGGRMAVNYDAKYNRATASYRVNRLLSCKDGFPDDSGADAVREKLCLRWLNQTTSPRDYYTVVEHWLQIPNERRKLSAFTHAESGDELLRLLDAEGYQWQYGAVRSCRSHSANPEWAFQLRLYAADDKPDRWTSERYLVVSRRPGAEPRVVDVRDDSPCPIAEVPIGPELEEFTMQWLEQPWPDARVHAEPRLSAQHASLRRAHLEQRLDVMDVAGCASARDKPAWVWTAAVTPPSSPEQEPRPTPVYVVLERHGERLHVASVSDVRPNGCQVY